MKARKKTGSMVDRAIIEVPGFASAIAKFEQQVVLKQKSQSTLRNYGKEFAQMCLALGSLPEKVSDAQINAVLYDRIKQDKHPSLSGFKHAVCSLRFYFRMLDIPDRAVKLPVLKKNKSLPVVLNHDECKRLFHAPDLLKHKIILALIYSAGLRSRELSNLRVCDVDTKRMMIHIRQSKYNKDRYVPLSSKIADGLKKYMCEYKPKEWLFNGLAEGQKFSSKGIQWVMHRAVKKAGIIKNATVHTLRHSYATHLLEWGMDIVSIKELLGHERIETTLIYLHVAQANRTSLFSPFDKLYEKSQPAKV
jgi:site-specific recombinase XerD